MSHAIALICAAINADDAAVRLDVDEMREVIDALDERERSIGRERTRADAAEAEVARLRAQVEYLAPRQRAGQLVANAMHWLDATFYENARNTEIDPWEHDDNVKEYLDHWRDALVVPWVQAAADARSERDAARAEAAGLRAECAAHERAISRLTAERDADREDADALREAVAGLRAIVEGRTVAPTDAEVEVHERAGGRWRCALVHLRGGHDWMDDDDARAKVRLSAPGTWRWWALDATGRPCPWPTVMP